MSFFFKKNNDGSKNAIDSSCRGKNKMDFPVLLSL